MHEGAANEAVAIAFHGEVDFQSFPHERRQLELANATRAIDAYLACANGQVLECGAVCADTNDPNKAWFGDIEIGLTPKEYSLLVHFLRRQGQWLRSNSILSSVWSHAQRNERQYLRVYVAQLRAKFPGYILTKGNFGYMFRAPEEVV